MNVDMMTAKMPATPLLHPQGPAAAREPVASDEQPLGDRYTPEADEEEGGEGGSPSALMQSLSAPRQDTGAKPQGSADISSEPTQVRVSDPSPDMVAGPGGPYNPSTQKQLRGELAGFDRGLREGRPFVQLNDKPPVYGVITHSANGDLTVLMGPSAPKGVPSDFTVTGALRYEKTPDGHLRRSFCSAERPWSCHLQTTRDGQLHNTMWPVGNGCIPQAVVQ